MNGWLKIKKLTLKSDLLRGRDDIKFEFLLHIAWKGVDYGRKRFRARCKLSGILEYTESGPVCLLLLGKNGPRKL